MRRAVAFLVALVLSVCLGGLPAAAQGPGTEPLVIVFDTSGSMADPDPQGTVKLSTAKNAMANLVRGTTDASVALGLWTYPGGLTDQFGCEPGGWVPHLSPEELPDPTDVDAQIRLLTADGGTPTGPALQAVVDRLRGAGFESGTIVLVSDGEANCGPPPCEVAQDIVDGGFDLTVAAVAFDIASDVMRDDLQCIADATGGSYSTATDADQLLDQLSVFESKQLTLDVTAPTVVRSGEVMKIQATVTNPSRNPVSGATLTLTFDELDVARYIPAPQRRFPTLQPGESVTRSWTIGTSSTVLGDRGWRILAGTSTGAVVAAGVVTFTKDPLRREDAGPLLPPGGTVLVLGDSYSSGEGVGSYNEEKGDKLCHRSQSSYGGVIGGAETAVIACSGAVSHDILRDVDHGGGGQLAQLARATDPAAIFLTIGGNDIGFAGIVTECFVRDCAPNRAVYLTRIGGRSWADTYEKVSGVVNSKAAVAERGGRLIPLIVSPYPDPFWDSSRGACNTSGISAKTLVALFSLSWTGDVGFSRDEIEAGKQILTALNGRIEASVREARDQGIPVYFAAGTQGFATAHSICEEDSYFVRLTPATAISSNPIPARKQELFHPNAAGHEAWANALITWSQGEAVDATLQKQAEPESVWDRVRTLASRPVVPSSLDLQLALQVQEGVGYPRPTVAQHLTPTGWVTVEIRDLAPGSFVTMTVRSRPITLAAARADDEGNVTVSVELPELSSGRHELTVEGYDDDYRLVGATVDLWVSGGITWAMAAVAAVSLLAAVALIVVAVRWGRLSGADD